MNKIKSFSIINYDFWENQTDLVFLDRVSSVIFRERQLENITERKEDIDWIFWA